MLDKILRSVKCLAAAWITEVPFQAGARMFSSPRRHLLALEAPPTSPRGLFAPGYSVRSVNQIINLYKVPMLRMGGELPLFPQFCGDK